MEYYDEQVLQMRQREKEKGYTTLETGIYVDRKLIEFCATRLFDERIEIMLPKTFIDMPGAVIKVKYPSEYRPEIIKTSLDGTVNFTFNLFDIMIDGPDGLEEVAAHFQAVLTKVNPALKVNNYEAADCKEQPCRFFSYKSFGLDIQMYNLIGIMQVKDQVLQICFNCPYDDYRLWEEIAKMVVISTKIL